MAYNTMKKLIMNANAKKETGAWTEEEYSAYREDQSRKIDVFFAMGRITEPQYDDLMGMWL